MAAFGFGARCAPASGPGVAALPLPPPMARASPGSGSHPGNLLTAFFGERACGEPSFREGPALPGAFPPRAGPRLLGGLLIAAMLHGVGVRAVPASLPVVSRPRQNDGVIWSFVPARIRCVDRGFDLSDRLWTATTGQAANRCQAAWDPARKGWKSKCPFILKGSSNAAPPTCGADEFPAIFSLALAHSHDIPAHVGTGTAIAAGLVHSAPP